MGVRKFRIPLVFALAACMSVPLLAFSVGEDADAATAGPRIGINDHPIWRPVVEQNITLGALDDLHAGAVRLDMPWNFLEPVDGSYQAGYLARLDNYVAGLTARGIDPIVVVRGTPGWANGGKADNVPPTDPAKFAEFMGFLASRYKGQVKAWEIWNEPTLSMFFSTRDPFQYTQLLKPAYTAIKAADPSALVAVAAGSGSNTIDAAFLEGVYKAGGKGFFDVLSVHNYGDLASRRNYPAGSYPVAPAKLMDDLKARFQPILTSYGDSPRIWMTETGMTSGSASGNTEASQAAYMQSIFDAARASGWVERVFDYQLLSAPVSTADPESNYGVMDKGAAVTSWPTSVVWRKKPAYSAFATASGFLTLTLRSAGLVRDADEQASPLSPVPSGEPAGSAPVPSVSPSLPPVDSAPQASEPAAEPTASPSLVPVVSEPAGLITDEPAGYYRHTEDKSEAHDGKWPFYDRVLKTPRPDGKPERTPEWSRDLDKSVLSPPASAKPAPAKTAVTVPAPTKPALVRR